MPVNLGDRAHCGAILLNEKSSAYCAHLRAEALFDPTECARSRFRRKPGVGGSRRVVPADAGCVDHIFLPWAASRFTESSEAFIFPKQVDQNLANCLNNLMPFRILLQSLKRRISPFTITMSV